MIREIEEIHKVVPALIDFTKFLNTIFSLDVLDCGEGRTSDLMLWVNFTLRFPKV